MTQDDELRQCRELLGRLASELTLAEERQRRELAEHLHDHVGQALALLRRKLLTLRDRAMFSGLEKDLDELVDLSARTVHSIRSLSFDLSPPVLYELGLAAALDWLAERHDGQEGVKVSFHAGARPAPPLEPDRHDLPAAGPSRLDRLSSREREVLQRLAEGAGTRQIAESLHLSPKTVETHRAQLMEKLGLHSVAELTKLAIREGLTHLE